MEARFEQSCGYAEDTRARPFEPETVEVRRRTGFFVQSNYRSYDAKGLSAAAGLPSGVTPGDCGFKLSEVRPSSPVPLKGYSVQSPDKPFVELGRIDAVWVDHVLQVMPERQMLVAERGRATCESDPCTLR